MKATYQPSKRRRARKCGFRVRNRTKDGKNTLKRRKLKGRWSLTPGIKTWN